MDKQDIFFMQEALKLADMAAEHGNEPFGAVLVKDSEIVFSNENQVHTQSDPTFHAEIGLIRLFCNSQNITDLSDYTLYSSCEPCFMCSCAMVWTKLGRLVYSASNKDLCSLFKEEGCECSDMVFQNSSHKPQVTGGVLRDEGIKILVKYFPHRA